MGGFEVDEPLAASTPSSRVASRIASRASLRGTQHKQQPVKQPPPLYQGSGFGYGAYGAPTVPPPQQQPPSQAQSVPAEPDGSQQGAEQQQEDAEGQQQQQQQQQHEEQSQHSQQQNSPQTATTGSQPFAPFRTFEPTPRQERRAGGDKFALEKARIAARNPHAPPPPDDPLLPDSHTALYMDRADQFARRDPAAAEHDHKLERLQKKEELYERKRREQYERDAKRYEENEAGLARVEQIAAGKRERGEAGSRRNKGGESYNILSLAYTPDAGGEKLRLQDSMTHYKAHLRSTMLYTKNHSTSYNILTGEPGWRPPPVQPPVE